jgi:hypothetical protein
MVNKWESYFIGNIKSVTTQLVLTQIKAGSVGTTSWQHSSGKEG